MNPRRAPGRLVTLTPMQVTVLERVEALTHAPDGDGWARASDCAAHIERSPIVTGCVLGALRKRGLVERRGAYSAGGASPPPRFRSTDEGSAWLRRHDAESAR